MLLEEMTSAVRQHISLEPPDESWVMLRRQGLRQMNVLLQEGKLRPLDALVLMVLASRHSMQTGDVRMTLQDLRQELRVGSIAPTSYSLRRLRALGLVARVGGVAGRGFYVINPTISTAGGPCARRYHARLFKAAIEQAVPVRPATASAIRNRHALPSQLEPAAA